MCPAGAGRAGAARAAQRLIAIQCVAAGGCEREWASRGGRGGGRRQPAPARPPRQPPAAAQQRGECTATYLPHHHLVGLGRNAHAGGAGALHHHGHCDWGGCLGGCWEELWERWRRGGAGSRNGSRNLPGQLPRTRGVASRALRRSLAPHSPRAGFAMPGHPPPGRPLACGPGPGDWQAGKLQMVDLPRCGPQAQQVEDLRQAPAFAPPRHRLAAVKKGTAVLTPNSDPTLRASTPRKHFSGRIRLVRRPLAPAGRHAAGFSAPPAWRRTLAGGRGISGAQRAQGRVLCAYTRPREQPHAARALPRHCQGGSRLWAAWMLCSTAAAQPPATRALPHDTAARCCGLPAGTRHATSAAALEADGGGGWNTCHPAPPPGHWCSSQGSGSTASRCPAVPSTRAAQAGSVAGRPTHHNAARGSAQRP
jgi:hypothetical protein